MTALFSLEKYCSRVRAIDPLRVNGRIVEAAGLMLQATGPEMRIGDLCYLKTPHEEAMVPVEVVGFRGDRILLMPLGELHGVGPGSLVCPTFSARRVRVGNGLIGRVIDALGGAMDGKPAPDWEDETPLMAAPPSPMSRARIALPLITGVRSIDACVTTGKGQRVGVMAGTGVGKSKLLGMIARNTNADLNVIALIGERGREVREFIENDLGESGLERSIVVVATSNEPALRRISGAYTATAIAEWFRAQGHDVLLLLDSITRFAMAQREVGLAVGEPPTTKGYPPSVFSLLPKLLERAGNDHAGSITGMYAVLIEGDDFNDPIGDAVRGILDGHVALSRDLATRGHFPAVDILNSISRSMIDVVSETHLQLASRMRQIMAAWREAEDLINIGAYVPGSNPEIDEAIRLMPGIRAFLKQGLMEQTSFEQMLNHMAEILR